MSTHVTGNDVLAMAAMHKVGGGWGGEGDDAERAGPGWLNPHTIRQSMQSLHALGVT